MAGELAKKLNLKPGMDVLLINAPDGYLERLRADFPEGTIHTLAERPGGKGHFDFVHLFVRDSGELESFYNTAHAAMRPDTIFWISYPKQSSGVKSDLNRDSLHVRIISDGWQGVRQVSLDDTWSALRYKRPDVSTHSDLVAAQYSGAKVDLRPIYNYVVEIVQALGDDVQITPRANYVAFVRKQQFAAIAAAARDRVDLALRLKGRPYDDFVQENTGVGGGALTHKVSLSSTMDVNDVVAALLYAAYVGAG
jgi:predicted transport protein